MTYDSFLSSIKRILHQLHQLSTWSKNLTLDHQTKNKRISLDSPSLWPLVELPVVGSAVHIPNFVAMDPTLEKVLAELNVGLEIFIKPTFLWKHVCWSHIIYDAYIKSMHHITDTVYLCDVFLISLSDDVSFLFNLPGPYVWHVSHLHDRRWSVSMSSWGGFDLRRFRLSTGKVPFSRSLGLQRLLCHEQSSKGVRYFINKNGVFFPNCSTDVFKLFSESFRPFFPTTPEFQLSLPWPRSVTPGWSRVWKNQTLAAQITSVSNHRCSITYYHCLSLTLDLITNYVKETPQKCVEWCCRIVPKYESNIPIHLLTVLPVCVCVCVCVTMLSHLGAPTATGGGAAAPSGVLSAFAPGSSTGERTRRSSWEQEICLQLRRCYPRALPCPDGRHVERENVGRWCRPITPALQYRKSWICLEHFSFFFEWELDSWRKVLEITNICKHHKGTCLEQKS